VNGGPIAVETLLSAEDQRRWDLVEIVDVNDSGQLVGWGRFNPDGTAGEPGTRQEIFLMTPTPEPGGLVALVVGMLLLCRREGNRRPVPAPVQAG
jgi:hypothetical protein